MQGAWCDSPAPRGIGFCGDRTACLRPASASKKQGFLYFAAWLRAYPGSSTVSRRNSLYLELTNPLKSMDRITLSQYRRILFFTGAGMSAESGVPTYRGKGGVWKEYDYEEYACQKAFDRNPEKVLRFHELRRQAVLDCLPHEGHRVIAGIPGVKVITQNIDGMHQRAGSEGVIELHGTLWRLRCDRCRTVVEDHGKSYETLKCACGAWLRPDIIWFGDMLDPVVVRKAKRSVEECDLFISIGTSGTVWPAAGFPALAREWGAYCIEINPEPSGGREYHRTIAGNAGAVLPELFIF